MLHPQPRAHSGGRRVSTSYVTLIAIPLSLRGDKQQKQQLEEIKKYNWQLRRQDLNKQLGKELSHALCKASA